ncbi:hypothetical protein [Halovenus salina]|uniref:Uncharacterized protein n=1 Tax=Halovenus salina TaxID=1510225 RepID=A0ABD5VVJ6_9EURY|nr:hypothetical protein [Halovenus salina]
MAGKFARFLEEEIKGETILIAVPKDEADDTVTIKSNWLKGNNGLEDAVRSILQDRLVDKQEIINGDSAVLRRDAIIESLRTSNMGQMSTITDDDTAEALLEYFISEEVFSTNEDGVVVLHDPHQFEGLPSTTVKYRSRCWAANIESYIDFFNSIDQMIDGIYQGYKQRYVNRSSLTGSSTGYDDQLPRFIKRFKAAKGVNETRSSEMQKQVIKGINDIEKESLTTTIQDISELIKLYDSFEPILDPERFATDCESYEQLIKETNDVILDDLVTDPPLPVEELGDAEELSEAVDQMFEELGDPNSPIEDGSKSDDSGDLRLE